jgi:MFS family permease
MKQLLMLQGMFLVVFVLLGNGLRSIATMSVSVSQGEFASFLNISVEKTGVLIEILLGGAVMALAIAPFLINPRSARRVATIAAVGAAACYGAIGLTMRINPELLTREIVIISCFALGGFAVAFFAPLAQLSISTVTNETERVRLMTVWTAAQPIAFLLAPQLVKYIAFDIGIDNYFMILAVVPLMFLLMVPMIFGPEHKAPVEAPSSMPWPLIGVFLLAVLAFEAWTISNSFAGIENLLSLSLMSLFIVITVAVALKGKSALATAPKLPTTAISLLVLLFVLQIPTTGLYDTAYLVRHLCSSDLIMDRATLGAACQIMAVFAGGAVLAKWPHLETLMITFAVLSLFVGTVATAFYPFQGEEVWLFYASKVLTAIGMGTVTSIIVTRVAGVSQGNKIIMLAPAFVIMFGTEVGIELLEIVFQSAKLAGSDEVGAYQAIFLFQTLAVLLALGLIAERSIAVLWARRAARGQPMQVD